MHKHIMLAALLFAGICVTLNAEPNKRKRRKTYADDGVEQFKAPKDQLDYLKSIPEEYRKYFITPKKAIEAWQDDRFGVFIHWDPSCQVTGSVSWARKGPRPHHSSDGKVTKGIPEKVYNSQYKTFNPVKFDADKWVKMVKDAGAKYLVFTSKHHNGFCMFDTPTTDYCIRNTPYKKDICTAVAKACHKYGIKLFWYYSQPDWTEPTYRYDVTSKDFKDKYLKNYMYPQLKQLLTKYGRIEGIWFDGLGMKPQTWESEKMMKLMRENQPDLIVNGRFAPAFLRMGDYDGPENALGRFQVNYPWETCFRIGGAWGYTKNAHPLSLKDAINLLVRCAGNGGNLLLNTGPAPDGTIQASHIKRYLEMGQWLKKYGNSVYGTRGGPYKPGPWGCSTRSKNGNSVYLHILAHWYGKLTLPALPAKILKAEIMTDPSGKVSVVQKNGKLQLQIADAGENELPNPIDTVIKVTIDKKAMDLPIISTVTKSLTIGANVKASSSGKNGNKMTTPDAVVATTLTEFDDGAFVKATWRSDRKDKKPWIEITLEKPALISELSIQEGLYGKNGTVEAFTVSLKSNGQWKEVYQGAKIGGSFSLVLQAPMKADAIRIDFNKFTRFITLNAINAFGPAKEQF